MCFSIPVLALGSGNSPHVTNVAERRPLRRRTVSSRRQRSAGRRRSTWLSRSAAIALLPRVLTLVVGDADIHGVWSVNL